MSTLRSIVLVCLLCGCSGDEPGAEEVLELSLAARVPGGTEVHRCQLIQMPAGEETFVVAASHRYSPGSHHMLLFATDLTEITPDLAGVRDCYEDGTGLMSHVRGVVYGSQEQTGELVFPEGVGLPLAPGAVLMLQAHYLNAGTEELEAEVRVTLREGAAGEVRQRAGVLFYYDPFIHVPPRSTATANMSCTVPSAVTLLTATSHMHQRGTGYAAFLDAPGGRATEPFYTTDAWDHPGALAAPLAVPAGATIRFSCDYTNPEDRAFYQGQSAANDEMCMFVGIYYPAMTRLEEWCGLGPHDFGAGTASCTDTLDCVRACPPGSAPGGLEVFYESGVADVHPCWQACLAGSCPNAWAPTMGMLRCIQTTCAEACAGGSGCEACVAGSCLTEYLACSQSGC